jgi:hypothetical protein
MSKWLSHKILFNLCEISDFILVHFVSFQIQEFHCVLDDGVPAQAARLSGKRILLLEGSPQQSMDLKPRYNNRVSSLNNGTKSLLQLIGAWKHIVNARYKTVKKLQVQKCVYVTYVEQTVRFGPCCHSYLGMGFLTDGSEKFSTSY